MANKHGQHRNSDTRYLEKHQDLWRCVVGYRREGKVIKVRRSLGTASLREAQRLRWPIVAALKAGVATTSSSSTDEAEAWKAALAVSTGSPYDPTVATLSDHLDAIRGDPVVTEADEEGHPVYLYDPQRERRAAEFADRVYGRATPLDAHVDAFLASRGELREDTKARHEAAVRDLAGWLKREDLPATIQAVDRRTSIRYADQLAPGRPDPKRLSLYWQWLVKREHAQADPWRDLSAPPRARQGEPERAFTNDEVRRLLAGTNSARAAPALLDLMKVLALTGARLDAVIRLRVEDGLFVFPPQKKEVKARLVPIHSDLREIVERRSRMSSFWPEFPNSMAASKQFTRFRRKVGIGGDDSGRRRAVVNAHSFRRTWATWAERAGVEEALIAAVLGHRRPGLSLGRYSAGPSMEQLRRAVGAVKLPT
jgi:integrase